VLLAVACAVIASGATARPDTLELKQTHDRFNVGEVTRTDVAQAESRSAAGRSALLQAQSNYVIIGA
jgi:hypothetical protein